MGGDGRLSASAIVSHSECMARTGKPNGIRRGSWLRNGQRRERRNRTSIAYSAPSGRSVSCAISTWGVAPGYGVMALQAICDSCRTVLGQGARGVCARAGQPHSGSTVCATGGQGARVGRIRESTRRESLDRLAGSGTVQQSLVEREERFAFDPGSRREAVRGVDAAGGGPGWGAFCRRSDVAVAVGVSGRGCWRVGRGPGVRGGRKNVIFLYLAGGPPQHETFDPKPEAPVEIRGPFQPIQTNVPGIQFCELLPRTARMAEKLAVVRSMATDDNVHSSSSSWVLTGYKYRGPNPRTISPTDWPYFGSIVKMLRPADSLPGLSTVWLPHMMRLNENVTPAGQTGGFSRVAVEPGGVRRQSVG